MPEAEVKNPPSHATILDRVPGDKSAYVAPAQAVEENAVEAKPATEAVEQQAAPTRPNLDDVSDEEFLALYEKRTGTKAKSIDDLKPAPKKPSAEEQLKLDEQEANESLEWGIASGKVNKKDYETAVVAKAKEKREIALSLFTQELQSEDNEISADECEERFREYYGEDADDDSWRRKKGLKEMNAVADSHLAQFSAFDKLTDEYREFKTNSQRQKEYNKQIKTLTDSLPKTLTFKVPYEGVDGQNVDLDYEVPVDGKITTQLAKEFEKLGTGNSALWDSKPETISAELNYHLKARMMDSVLPQLLKSHAERVEMDIMAKLKNARAPQSQLGSQSQSAEKKEPPSHSAVLNKVK